MNSKAIAVYVDDRSHLRDEFNVLYESYLYNKLDDQFDVILFYAPSKDSKIFIERFADKSTMICQPCESISDIPTHCFYNYHFINSIHALSTPSAEFILKKYQYVLKTDCDVVLTKNVLDWHPAFFTTGVGQYVCDDTTRNKIQEFANSHNIRNNMENLGATWFGAGHLVSEACTYTMKYATEMYLDWWKDGDEGMWPSLYRGVVSMYASQMGIQKVCQR